MTSRCSASSGLQREASPLCLPLARNLPFGLASLSPSASYPRIALPLPLTLPEPDPTIREPHRCLTSITLPKLDIGNHSQPGKVAVVAGWGHLADADGDGPLAGKSPDELHSSMVKPVRSSLQCVVG